MPFKKIVNAEAYKSKPLHCMVMRKMIHPERQKKREI